MSDRDVLLGNKSTPRDSRCSRRARSLFTKRNLVIAAVFFVFVLVIVLAVVLTRPADPLQINVNNVVAHLHNLQQIADAANNHNSRSIVNGYADSAAYVEKELHAIMNCQREAFLAVTTGSLAEPHLVVHAPLQQPKTLQNKVDFAGVRYGGNSTVSLRMADVSLVVGDGCDALAYTSGHVALVSRTVTPTCSLIDKAMTAQAANVTAVLMFNGDTTTTLLGSRIRGAGWAPGDPTVTIPVLSVSNLVGALLSSAGAQVDLEASPRIFVHPTFNVICEPKNAPAGGHVVMVGGHLDSVAAGPGINDNGSGSMSVLEIAKMWPALGETVNTARFAFWGAEEEGLLGSRHYVANLPASERDRIALYLNCDMLASPNFVRQLHNCTDAPAAARAGSCAVQQKFVEWFVDHGVQYKVVAMRSGSDFVPFMESGIPSGGVKTGAGALKSIAERAVFHGLAKAQLDTCYHASCDTMENINVAVLEDLSFAGAFGRSQLSKKMAEPTASARNRW